MRIPFSYNWNLVSEKPTQGTNNHLNYKVNHSKMVCKKMMAENMNFYTLILPISDRVYNLQINYSFFQRAHLSRIHIYTMNDARDQNYLTRKQFL